MKTFSADELIPFLLYKSDKSEDDNPCYVVELGDFEDSEFDLNDFLGIQPFSFLGEKVTFVSFVSIQKVRNPDARYTPVIEHAKAMQTALESLYSKVTVHIEEASRE